MPVKAAQRQLSQFENLFKNLGDVANGFPKSIPFAELAQPRRVRSQDALGKPDVRHAR